MRAMVVIPWRGGCSHRAAALEWVASRHMADGHAVHVSGAEDGPWRKALAVVPAIEAVDDEAIVAVADADVWCDGLGEALEQVADGAPWAIPHRLVHRIDAPGTESVLAGENWRAQPLDQRPYLGIEGGGILVARRETLLAIPPDPRFEGWGQEDESWALALRTLAGDPWRGDADLVHLWHPPQERLSRRRGSVDGWTLRKRYGRACGDATAMRALIEEARNALTWPAEPAVHDRPSYAVG